MQTQIGKVVFIYSGKYAGPKVFDFISSVAMRSAANAAVAVPVDLQDLWAMQSPSVEFSPHGVFCCGFSCAVASSQQQLCILKTCLRASRRSAILCQAPANGRSEKFPVDHADKILLLQTGSTREDWVGGLKPHFCSISFGNPISQIAFVHGSSLACGIIHTQIPATHWQPLPFSSILSYYPGEGFIPTFRCVEGIAGSQSVLSAHKPGGRWAISTMLHSDIYYTSIIRAEQFPLLLYGSEVEVPSVSRSDVLSSPLLFLLFMEVIRQKYQNKVCWCRWETQLILH